jgi:hypothetical protein
LYSNQIHCHLWNTVRNTHIQFHSISIPRDGLFDLRVVKRRVVQQWLAGETREKIIADNNIGAGTVSIIVDDYKTGLDNFDLDSFRELTLEAKK